MKRLIALLLCIGMFAAVAVGCGQQKQEVATGDEAKSLNAADYEDTYAGLCNYLSAYGYINPLEDNKGLTYTVMNSDLIGAKQGRRFNCKHTENKSATVEIYEYDLEGLKASPDEAATTVLESVKKTGTFTNLIGGTVKDVYMSDNGKYMLIYNDDSIKDDTKEDDKNFVARKELVEKFKKFHA